MQHQTITIEQFINADINRVWDCFTQPHHITKWNFASGDWHCPAAENEVKPGGKFRYRMAAKDGSAAFDFEGIFNIVRAPSQISYTLGDGRQVFVELSEENGGTRIIQSFEAEDVHSTEMQREGWKAILDNLRWHVEGLDDTSGHTP